MKKEQSVPKRRHIKFRRRGITQKKEYKLSSILFIYLCITRRYVGIVALQGRVNNASKGTRPNWLLCGHFLGGNGSCHKILSHDSRCLVRVSNKNPTKYKDECTHFALTRLVAQHVRMKELGSYCTLTELSRYARD